MVALVAATPKVVVVVGVLALAPAVAIAGVVEAVVLVVPVEVVTLVGLVWSTSSIRVMPDLILVQTWNHRSSLFATSPSQ